MMTEGFTLPPTPTPSGERGIGDEFVSQINNSAPPAGTGATSTNQTPSMVFVGYFPANAADDTPRGYGSETTGNGGPNLVPTSVLLDNFEDMDRWQQRQVALLLTLSGFLGEVDLENVYEVARGASYGRVLAAYGDLLDNAAARAAAGQRVTPEQLLTQAVSYRLGTDWSGKIGDLKDILAEHGVKPGKDDEPKDETTTYSDTSTNTTTQSQTTRSIMDPDDAMALTRGLMQQELGRDPTKEEMEDFIATLQHASRTNPSRSTSKNTTTTTSTGTDHSTDTSSSRTSNTTTDQSSSTTTHQGIGAAGLEDRALRKIRQNPDWAEWQAVGTYAPALFQALGATVPGV